MFMKCLLCGQDGDVFRSAVDFLLQYLERLDTYLHCDHVGPFGCYHRMVHSDCLGIY